ncbi:MAG: hypothetical protein ACE5PV_15660, partial [Candidatus Poribacteria bacterium]
SITPTPEVQLVAQISCLWTFHTPSEKLHDRRIGDMLDEIHPHLSSIYQEIVLKAIQSFGIPTDFVHYDVTSLLL